MWASAPTLVSIGSIRSLTAASFTDSPLPGATCQTMVSVSPDAIGNCDFSKSSAREESVAGSLNSFAYAVPTARPINPMAMNAVIQRATTIRRCR